MRRLLIMAVVVACSLASTIQQCAATGFTASPQYLSGQLPARGVLVGARGARYTDDAGPIKLKFGTNPFYYLYYFDASLSGSQRFVGIVRDQDTAYDEGNNPYPYWDQMTIEWDFGDGSPVSSQTWGDTGTPPQHTYSAPGLYTAVWKIKDLHTYSNIDHPETDDTAIAGAPAGWDDSGQVQIEVINDTTPPTTPVVIDDGTVTTSTTTLHATWSAQDPETGILQYTYAIGTSPGGTNVVNWSNVSPANATQVTRTGLSLVPGQTYYFSVKAKNNVAELWSQVGSSDGIQCAAPGNIIHVRPDGNDANDGYTWSQAKQSVSSGISAAPAGGQVWVASGTYIACTILSASRVYGGFAGTETADGQRQPSTNVTTLRSYIGSPVVIIGAGTTSDTCIDGFTITNGNSTYGGGIRCDTGSYATISNNVITGNTSTRGGGIYCTDCSPLITKNVITANQVTGMYGSGGGIYLMGANPTIEGNTISSNTCDLYGRGGGIWLSQYSTPLITGNLITENSVGTNGTGGGICSEGFPNIANNAIVSNHSGATSGGIHIVTDAIVKNNTITYNTALWWGGLYYGADDPYGVVANNIIAFNGDCGFVASEYDPPRHQYNCIYGNSSNYGGPWPDPTEISVDPLLYADNYHLTPTSPCKNAGGNADVLAGELDIDGDWRIMDGVTDIGCDEITGCIWRSIAVTPSAEFTGLGETITITATVTRRGIPVPNVTVSFSATSPGQVSPTSAVTDSQGHACTTVTSASTGFVTVTATASDDCATQVSGQCTVYFGSPCKLMFCIDTSGSMIGTNVLNGIIETVDYLKERVPLQVGGVKFQDDGTPLSIFNLTTDYSAFGDWVSDTTFDGGDEPQLDAMWTAMSLFGIDPNYPDPYNHVLALATDEDYSSYSPLPHSALEVRTQMLQFGIKSYIDPTSSCASYYDGTAGAPWDVDLTVNGGIEYDLGTYTFPKLREEIGGVEEEGMRSMSAPQSTVEPHTPGTD